MENIIFPEKQVSMKFVKVQKNGPNSLSVGLAKIMATDLSIQKGTYVIVHQSGDRIIIEKVNTVGEW
jgi:antitoxin component of MazEF toxin-antitoxin module